MRSPRVALARALLQQPEAITPDYTEQIDELLALLRGQYRSRDGLDAHVSPGEGAGVEVWILGSGGGESAEVAGRNGLRFAANYHVSPATILEGVEAYREAFRPGHELDRPYVCVSVDAVVGETEEQARHLAQGHGLGSSGSAREKVRFHSRVPNSPARTPGRRTRNSLPTESQPRWWARRSRWWSSSSSWCGSPEPTNSS